LTPAKRDRLSLRRVGLGVTPTAGLIGACNCSGTRWRHFAHMNAHIPECLPLVPVTLNDEAAAVDHAGPCAAFLLSACLCALLVILGVTETGVAMAELLDGHRG
jgi:hypothetical protein